MSSISTDVTAAMAAAGSTPQAASASPAPAPAPARRDQESIRKALAGDRSAFADLALAWQDRIYNALRKLTGNEHDAADLTQETFVRALSSLANFRNESSAYTWLFRIAMNLAASRHRQLTRRKTKQESQLGTKTDGQERQGVLEQQVAAGDAPEQAAQKHERDQVVLAALGRLDEDQRKLLVMRDIEQMDYQEIAQVLDIPLGTLKSRLFRARLALREELKGYFGTQENVTP